MSYYSESKEWKYLFKNAICWDKIIPLYHQKFPTEDGVANQEELLQFYEELLEGLGDWSQKTVAPRALKLDEEGAGKVENGQTFPGPTLSQTYKEAKELEVFGVSIGTEFGGLGLPTTIALVGLDMLSRACLSSTTQIGFFSSIADMIERFCDHEDAQRLVPKILKGELSGSMCLTEPGCGSDLGSIRTSATPVEGRPGFYKLNGTKCFITNAGGGVGFVLARIKGAPKGLGGISLFLVEQFLKDEKGETVQNFQVTKNEDKMGLHGSFTCEVVYEDSLGKLVGEENKGLKLMFYLMNEARIAVGVQALGGMEACLDHIEKYSRERSQFGKILMDLPLYRKNYLEWKCEVDAFRAFVVDTIGQYDIFQKLHLKTQKNPKEVTPEEKKLFSEASKIIRHRTPLVKFYGTEAFTKISVKAIQAFGGYGFMREYEVERIHRDSFAPLLYEGTSQIQSLMALKDLIKSILKDPATFFLDTLVNNPLLSFARKNLHPLEKQMRSTQFQFQTKLLPLLVRCMRPEKKEDLLNRSAWKNEKGMENLMTYAESLCEIQSLLEILEVLTKQAIKDPAREELLENFRKLATPRIEAIYSHWKEGQCT